MTETRRARLYEELSMASRRYLAAYVLFNQAIADHLGLHPTDVQCPEPAHGGTRAAHRASRSPR